MIANLLLLSGIEMLRVACPIGAHEPQLSVSSDGNVALAWTVKGELYCSYGQPDDERNFLRSQHLRYDIWEPLKFSVGMRRGPRIAMLDDRRLVISAIGGSQGGGKDGDVYAWRHLGDTAPWPDPVRVNSVAGSAREGLHTMTQSQRGEVYCAWIDLRSGKPQIYGALSSDCGKTWTNEALVSKEAEVCPCCAPSSCFDGNSSLCVMWRGVHAGARDMQLARSSDAGKTFGAAVKLGSGTWKLDSCPMDGGAVGQLPEGGVLAAWRRERQIFTANDGASETLSGTGEQPWIAGGALVWLEKRNGKLFALLPGAPEPQTLDSSANDPVIAARPNGKGALYAAWETGAGEETKIRLARLPAR